MWHAVAGVHGVGCQTMHYNFFVLVSHGKDKTSCNLAIVLHVIAVHSIIVNLQHRGVIGGRGDEKWCR